MAIKIIDVYRRNSDGEEVEVDGEGMMVADAELIRSYEVEYEQSHCVFDTEATGTCDRCGTDICDQCGSDVDDEFLCSDCASIQKQSKNEFWDQLHKREREPIDDPDAEGYEHNIIRSFDD